MSLHYEVELGLVIGKTIRDLTPPTPAAADSSDNSWWQPAIAHYLLSIDMTARNVQDEAKRKGLPWDIAKGFDTFLPISAPIAASTIKDPHDVELYLNVNGKERQRDSTALMLFRIGRQLSDISRVMTLEEGDIVLTGTPKGVGPVETGDVIEAGLRVGGKELEEAKIKVGVEERTGPYEFRET